MLTRTALGILNARYVAVLRHCRMIAMAAVLIPCAVQSGTLNGEEVIEPTTISTTGAVIEGEFRDFANRAFTVNGGLTTEAHNVIFENNSHESTGGAIYIPSGTLNFTGDYTIFTGNSTPFENNRSGGAITTFGGGYLNFNAEETIFTGNSSKHGGAIKPL